MKYLIFLSLPLFFFSCKIETDNNTKEICSIEEPNGICPNGQNCENGQCVTIALECSIDNPDGFCLENKTCFEGECFYQCSSQYNDGVCQGDDTCINGVCETPCSLNSPSGYCSSGYFCDLGNCVDGEPCSIDHPNGFCPNDLVCSDATCIENLISLGDFNTFNGKFAQLYHFESTTKVFGIDTFSTTDTILILDQVEDGDVVNVNATICDIDLINGESGLGPVQIVVPDAFVNSLNPSQIVYHLTQDGTNVLITHEKLIEIRGANFIDPANDPMPEDATDLRVYDQDGDGHPGMTIIATGVISGEMYTVQRTTSAINGYITSSDTFDGMVVWSDEQVVLEAENSVLEGAMLTTPHLEDSKFYTTRIDSNSDCQYVIDNKDILFSR
jgi:hypothetical protein